MGICSCGRLGWRGRRCRRCSAAPQSVASRCSRLPALHPGHWLLSKPAGANSCPYPVSPAGCGTTAPLRVNAAQPGVLAPRNFTLWNLRASELALQLLCGRPRVEKLEMQCGMDKWTVRMRMMRRECSQGSWPSGEGSQLALPNRKRGLSLAGQPGQPNLASRHSGSPGWSPVLQATYLCICISSDPTLDRAPGWARNRRLGPPRVLVFWGCRVGLCSASRLA